jgi:hypothetical protein
LRSLLLASLPISIKHKIFRYLVRHPAFGLKVMNFFGRPSSGGFDGSKKDLFGRV